MLEVYVLTACLYQIGCSEMSSAYYEQSAILQQSAKNVETRIRRATGERIYSIASAVILSSVHKKIQVQLSRNYNLTLSDNLITLNFVKGF